MMFGRIVALALLMEAFIGCATMAKGEGDGAQQASVRAGSVVAADSLSALIQQLGRLRGEFGFSDMTQTWEFIGDDKTLNAFGDFADSAVGRLVECLDAGSSTHVRVGDRQALLGVMCYTALRRVAYVENPPGGKPWAGVVSPDATIEQLRRAKLAWQEVVKKKLYRLL
jgi:hypothetical protein